MTTEAPPRPHRKDLAGGEVIVAGFHRSGTSATAGLLHQGGVHMGDDLVGARLSNPLGHYEDVEVVRLHESLLADNGRTWQVDEDLQPAVSEERWAELRAFVAGRRRGHRIWGFKDPRVCLFLPVWKQVLPEARVVLVFRHYAEAVASLHRREARLVLAGEDPLAVHRRFWEVPALALRMWLVHNRALLAFAGERRDDVVALSFDDLRAGMPLLSTLRSRWRLGLRNVPTFEAVQPGYPEPEHVPLRPAPRDLIAEADEVLAALRDLAAETADEGGGGA